MNKQLIKELVKESYQDFISGFWNTDTIDKEKIEDDIGPIKEVFSNQYQTDRAKQRLGKHQFNCMLSLYFAIYKTEDGINAEALDQDLRDHKKIFLRHIGPDKVNYLKLVVVIVKSLKEQRRGLLLEDAS